METSEVIKMAKKEAEVNIADLPERYIETIAKDIAEDVVYNYREKHYIRLTKHVYAGCTGAEMSLSTLLAECVLGTDAEAKTKEEYKEQKKNENSVFFYDVDKDKIYVYDDVYDKEYVFCGEKTKEEAIEWLAEEIQEYIEINDITDPWMIGLYYV